MFTPIFLYVEGESEETYFDCIRRLYSVSSCKIKKQKDTNILDILDSCIMEKRMLNRDGKFMVFMILDADNQNEADIIRATEKAKENDISIILSNLSFEIWLIMHFEKPTKVYTQNDYEERIRQLIGHTYYKSEGIGMLLTKESVQRAISNSKTSLVSDMPVDCKRTNESTMMYVVLEQLLKNGN